MQYHPEPHRPVRILRVNDVLARRGDCRTKMYDEVGQGLFPKPVPIGKRAVGWPESEVDAVVRARIAGKSDEEISRLVRRLEGARSEVAA